VSVRTYKHEAQRRWQYFFRKKSVLTATQSLYPCTFCTRVIEGVQKLYLIWGLSFSYYPGSAKIFVFVCVCVCCVFTSDNRKQFLWREVRWIRWLIDQDTRKPPVSTSLSRENELTHETVCKKTSEKSSSLQICTKNVMNFVPNQF